jgi:endonuclease YncB( thermonuclease family)
MGASVVAVGDEGAERLEPGQPTTCQICPMTRAWNPQRLAGTAVATLMLTAPASAELAGPPRIIEGDALDVAGQRIRLFGIDAPPLDQVCQHAGRDYQCGKVARAALWDLVAGLDVSCVPEAASPAADGSILATCSAGGSSLNETMVHTGWALADRTATDRYVATEANARAARRGLWRGEFDPPRAGARADAAGKSEAEDDDNAR